MVRRPKVGNTKSIKPWQAYQQNAAAYFRSLGLEASLDTRVDGVRTSHNIDVLVKSNHVGFEITWIVECKNWKTPVNKAHVLALRAIVAELGADRGILLSEAGFQSGAREAANLTNVQVTSISEMRETARDSFNAMRLRDLYDRIEICKNRYWDIPKDDRIDAGLRPDVGEDSYSGASIIELCGDLLTRAFRGIYPFESDTLHAVVLLGKDKHFHTAAEVIDLVQEKVSELETKLYTAKRLT